MDSIQMKRKQNEKKFGDWDELPNRGRKYWYDVSGRKGWSAHGHKKVSEVKDK